MTIIYFTPQGEEEQWRSLIPLGLFLLTLCSLNGRHISETGFFQWSENYAWFLPFTGNAMQQKNHIKSCKIFNMWQDEAKYGSQDIMYHRSVIIYSTSRWFY